jgi:vacuolar-type H+-ATPase subunit E/Vma4
MAQKEAQSELQKSSLFNLGQAEVAATAANYAREIAKVQTEVFDKWQETNKHWLDRISTEANLTSELASNLASARSVPDAIMACQKWNSRRLGMIAEDGRHLIAYAQKFAETGARLLSNGWQPKNSSAST